MNRPRLHKPPAYLGPNGRAEWTRLARVMGASFLAQPANLLLVELICSLVDLLALLEIELLSCGDRDHTLGSDEDGRAITRAARRVRGALASWPTSFGASGE